jgi:RNA polymerase sigma factor (sigma-70 family)
LEASTLQPAAALPKPRISAGAPLLRFRSDEQLVALFRAGHEEAFRAIHDRYHKRLFAYARQMLPGRQDAEDALQDVFVRAYSGLRASQRDLALRAWLFRVAHNRCIDELRRPSPPPPEVLHLVRPTVHDPFAAVDLRDSLRRLVEDIRRLPDQQRSALLMRELGGMSYVELASSLGVSVPAVKSLLVRARVALAQAAEARDTACVVIREQLVEAHDRGVRPSANARKHIRDCSSCKSFRSELRGVSRQLAGVAPAIGPLGFLANVLGFSGGGAAGGAGSGAAVIGGGGTAASAGGLALGTSHVATLIVAAVATAGGAVELQHTILPAAHRPAHVRTVAAKHARRPPIVRSDNAGAAVATKLSGATTAGATVVRPMSPAATQPAELPASAPIPHHSRKPLTASGGQPVVSTSTGTADAPVTATCPPATTTGAADGSASTDNTASTSAPASDPASSSSAGTSSSTPTSECNPSSGTTTAAPASSSSTSTSASTGTGTVAPSTSTTSGSGTATGSGSSSGASAGGANVTTG